MTLTIWQAGFGLLLAMAIGMIVGYEFGWHGCMDWVHEIIEKNGVVRKSDIDPDHETA